MPLTFAREARAAGVKRLVAAAFENETDPQLTELVDEIVWMRVGQLSRLIDTFASRGITECVMVGQIAPKNLFDLRPDLRAAKLLFTLKEKNAHTIFGGIANELAKDGVRLVEATPWLTRIMPGKDFVVGPKPGKDQQRDIQFGFRIAEEISRLDIGQLVVVKNGTVLAVEGFEGTDECLKRGGQLAGRDGGGIAVKVPKANHDFRFDIPCVGARTIETCANAGVAVLAFRPGKILLLEQDEVKELARNKKVALVAVSES